jgi:drug/metabolite transporter (DMT)-like permease
MKEESMVSRVRILGAFSLICLVWGSTFLAIRFAIETIPPFLMAGMRFLSAGLILYLLVRRTAGRPTRAQWKSALIIGVALFLFGNGLVTWSEQRVPSGIASLFVAMIPVWFVLVEWLRRDGTRPSRPVIAGLILGFVGMMLLVGNPFSSTQQIDLLGAGALFLSGIAWTNGSLYARKAELPPSQFLTASMEMLAGGVALTLAGTLMGEWQHLHFASVSIRSWVSLAYLSVFGSILAFTAYIWLLRETSPSRVATYAFINPIVALFLGSAFAGEKLSSQVFAAAGVIIFAVVLIVTSKSRLGSSLKKQTESELSAAFNREPSALSPSEQRSPAISGAR